MEKRVALIKHMVDDLVARVAICKADGDKLKHAPETQLDTDFRNLINSLNAVEHDVHMIRENIHMARIHFGDKRFDEEKRAVAREAEEHRS